jgi:hypothetical protein
VFVQTPHGVAQRGEKKAEQRLPGVLMLLIESSLIQETYEFLAATGLLQLANCLSLDLANSLARNLENVTDFFERIAITVAESVTELDNLAFTVTQRLEYTIDTMS